jgi:hypothetical protein
LIVYHPSVVATRGTPHADVVDALDDPTMQKLVDDLTEAADWVSGELDRLSQLWVSIEPSRAKEFA